MRRVTPKQRQKNKEKAIRTKKLHEWFLWLWDKREEIDEVDGMRYVKCFETGRILPRKLYREISACYSHILPKSKYGELAMEEFNVVIVHPEFHLGETSTSKTPKQNELRKQLKKEYGSSLKRNKE